MLSVLGVVIACISVPVICSGAVILVPSMQPTIQAGIDVASPGDTVLVAAGTYAGTGNRDLDFAGKDLVLRSQAGPATTIIDCAGSGRGFLFHTFETPASVIEGFTIRDGYANGTFGGGLFAYRASPTVRTCVFASCDANQGGGIYVEASSISIDDCAFTGNTADNWGGGFLCKSGSAVMLTACSFSGNAAARGGAVHVRETSTAGLSDCMFTANQGANSAAAIYCNDSRIMLIGCSFTGHVAYEGAALRCEMGADANLIDCVFSANEAIVRGAGIEFTDSDSLCVTGCVFDGNTTTSGPVQPNGGAAIFCRYASSCTIQDSEFTDNHALGAGSEGGAVYACDITAPQDTTAACVFTGNSALAAGGAVRFRNHNSITVECTFIDNQALAPDRGDGGGLAISGFLTELVECDLAHNYASRRGGGLLVTGSIVSIRDSRLVDNTALVQGGGIYSNPWMNSMVQITRVELVGNAALTGGGRRTCPGPGRCRRRDRGLCSSGQCRARGCRRSSEFGRESRRRVDLRVHVRWEQRFNRQWRPLECRDRCRSELDRGVQFGWSRGAVLERWFGPSRLHGCLRQRWRRLGRLHR